MMQLMMRAAVLVVLASVAGMGGWACNGDGESLSLEEYFEQLEALDDEFEQRTDEVFAEEPEDVESARESLQRLPEVVGDFVDDLEELDPPEEAEDAHEQAVEAGREVQEEFERIFGEIEDIDSLEALFAALEDVDFDTVVQRFDDACVELQQIADDNNIEVTLNCGDD